MSFLSFLGNLSATLSSLLMPNHAKHTKRGDSEFRRNLRARSLSSSSLRKMVLIREAPCGGGFLYLSAYACSNCCSHSSQSVQLPLTIRPQFTHVSSSIFTPYGVAHPTPVNYSSLNAGLLFSNSSSVRRYSPLPASRISNS